MLFAETKSIAEPLVREAAQKHNADLQLYLDWSRDDLVILIRVGHGSFSCYKQEVLRREDTIDTTEDEFRLAVQSAIRALLVLPYAPDNDGFSVTDDDLIRLRDLVLPELWKHQTDIELDVQIYYPQKLLCIKAWSEVNRKLGSFVVCPHAPWIVNAVLNTEELSNQVKALIARVTPTAEK